MLIDQQFANSLLFHAKTTATANINVTVDTANDTFEADDDNGESQEITEAFSNDETTNILEAFRWNDSNVKLLLHLYDKHKADFYGKKKTNRSIWKSIASEMADYEVIITWEQCENKFKNLKKTYKKVIDNNNKTGRGRIDWPYFNVMDDLFGNSPEVHPLSTCSDIAGFQLNTSSVVNM